MKLRALIHFDENISFSRNCDIKITNAKSVTDAYKNSDTLELDEESMGAIAYPRVNIQFL